MFERSNNPRRIDLHLPQSWNHCTTEELEAIAAAIIDEQQRTGRYHPFDWQRVKLAAALAINEISVFRNVEMSRGGGRNVEMPKFRNVEAGAAAADEWLVSRPEDSEPWAVSVGQLLALTDRLSWIDDEKSDKTVFLFPYPTLTLEAGGEKSEVAGPPPLLDGYTWREYRWLTDWMQEYMRLSNARRDATAAQREFLAILFKATSRNNDISTSRNNETSPALFDGFSPVKWQVILFWWSSLMSMLSMKFPRVFKSQPVGKHRPQRADTPWDFYNCVTATIQKYIGGLSEQDVNNATYGTVLQQLEMMADEAAEMEKRRPSK